MSNKRLEYWLSFEGKDLASELIARNDSKFVYDMNPLASAVARNTYAYNSTVLDAQSWETSLNFAGDKGELVKMSVPQARGQIRSLVTLLTKSKLAFNAVARVSKSDVTESVRIANAISAETIERSTLDIKQEKLVERGLIQGTSYIMTTWRSDLGKPKAVQQLEDGGQSVIYEGDNEIRLPSFFDVMFDHSIEDWEDQEWVQVRVKRNRWNLIAQHPELDEELKKIPSVHEGSLTSSGILSWDTRDTIYVYELYVKPSPALPQGRMFVYASEQCIIYDDVNPYEGLDHIQQLKAEPIEGIGYGYPMFSNLLPSQEMMDACYSALATNATALGVVNIATPKNSDIEVNQLYGMNFISYNPQNIPGGGLPTKLDLLQSAPELFKLPEILLQNMQQLSFVNAAVRGELPASTSGVAIATLTTNALEFLSSYSKNLQVILKKIMLQTVKNYQRFAKTERLVRMTGQNFQSFMKPFKADDLSPIESIEIQTINPLMQSTAGRLDIAEKALEKGLVKNLQAYVSILEGEPLQRLYRTELSQNDLIQSENERLIQGEPVLTLSTDNHAKHIYEHNALLNDPSIRNNGQRVTEIMQHNLEHLRLQTETDPMLMAMANTGLVPEMPQQPMQQQQAPEELQGDSSEPMMPELEMQTAEPAQPAEDLLGRN